MVNPRDAAITGIAVVASLALAISIAGASLPGSSTIQIVCDIPVVNNADFCDQVEPSDDYKISIRTTIDKSSIKKVEYKTENKEGNLFSFTGLNLAFPAETRNAKINYVVRSESGQIVATGTERMGTLVANEEKTDVFLFNEQAGDYTVKISYTGTECGLFTCNEVAETEEIGFSVPRLPLGQYETLEVNFT